MAHMQWLKVLVRLVVNKHDYQASLEHLQEAERAVRALCVAILVEAFPDVDPYDDETLRVEERVQKAAELVIQRLLQKG